MAICTTAIIGGTGPQGRGLGYRFALAGHRVAIGSRSAAKARLTADEISARSTGAVVRGLTNDEAASGADVVVLAMPYAGHREVVAALAPTLAGKVVISCVNPLGFDEFGPYGVSVPDGSAAEEAQRLLPAARVVAAFHHVSARSLWETPDPLDHEDVLVCTDHADAKEMTIDLARSVTGHPGVDAGPLRVARQLEPFTAVLINVNERYKIRSGIAVSGLRGGASWKS